MIITTHSSNILSGLSFEQFVILRTESGTVYPTKLEHDAFLESWLDDLGVTKTDRRAQKKKVILRWLMSFFYQYAEALFARFTLIVEGFSEAGAFPVWAKRMSSPNDLDQLGISLVVGGGSQLPTAARLLENLGAEYLLVCDSGDDHDLTGISSERIKQTIHSNFEEEVLESLPLYKVLRAIGASLSEQGLDGLYKYVISPVGINGLSDVESWEEVIERVEDDQLTDEDAQELKRVCREHFDGRLLKGADVGALLGYETNTLDEIPSVYCEALEHARQSALEIINHE